MITFILLSVGAVVVIAAIAISYGANQRKRAGQSGEAAVTSQQSDAGSPRVGRPTGVN